MHRLSTIGFDRTRMAAAMKAAGIPAMLLTSAENVYYTTGYTALPSAGNPILHMLRNRLPFFSFITEEGKVTLICWGFSASDMEFGADEVIGFNNLAEGCAAIEKLISERAPAGRVLGIERVCPHYALKLIEKARPNGEVREVDRLIDEL